MAYRFGGTDPFLRAAIGAFNGKGMEADALSGAALLKRNAVSAWHGIHTVDNGAGAVYTYMNEFNPSNQMAGGTDGVTVSTATFNDTTNWMIVGFRRAAGTGPGLAWTWEYKIGAGAWTTEADTWGGRTNTAGSGYRHVIGNEPGLGDDASFDLCCVGLIESNLAQATFETIDMLNFSTWQSVFTGAAAFLHGYETIATQVDRTGNGGDELSRSAGITLVSDPPGWAWSAAAPQSVAWIGDAG